LRFVWLPREPRDQLRDPGLRLGLGEAPPSGDLLRQPVEQPADGLLPARPAGPRRPRARRREAGARTLEDFVLRAGLSRRGLELLAEADAFRSLGVDRRHALWAVKGLTPDINAARDAPLLTRQSLEETQVQLPFMSQPKEVAEDYRTTSLSLKDHPVR